MRSFKKSARSARNIKNFRKKSRKRNIRKRTNRKQIAGAGALLKRLGRPLISPIRLKNFKPFKKRHRQYIVTPSMPSNKAPPAPFTQRPEVLSGHNGMNQIYARFSDVKRQIPKRQNTNPHSGELIYDSAVGPTLTRKNKPEFPIYVTPNKEHPEYSVYASLYHNNDTQYPPPLPRKKGNHSNNHSIYAEHAKLEHNPERQSRLIEANKRRKSLRGKNSNHFGPERNYDNPINKRYKVFDDLLELQS